MVLHIISGIPSNVPSPLSPHCPSGGPKPGSTVLHLKHAVSIALLLSVNIVRRRKAVAIIVNFLVFVFFVILNSFLFVFC